MDLKIFSPDSAIALSQKEDIYLEDPFDLEINIQKLSDQSNVPSPTGSNQCKTLATCLIGSCGCSFRCK